MHYAKLFSFALLLVCVAAARADQPSPDLQNESSVAALETKLADPDFQTRQDAQRIVEQLPAQAMPDLQRLAAAAANKEVKARLLAAVETIELRTAIDPPPISVSFKDATLDEVATALAQATGARIITSNGPGDNDRFTLAATDKSFWAIHGELNRQHPVWFSTIGAAESSIRLFRDTNPWKQSSLSHGFGVYIEELKTPLAALPGAAPPKAANAALHYATVVGLGADPRIHLIDIGSPDFASATDELGNRWDFSTAAPVHAAISSGPVITQTRSVSILVPPDHGKMLASLVGAFGATVSLEESTGQIRDPANHLNAPVIVGNMEVEVAFYTSTAQQTRITIIVKSLAGKEPLAAARPELARVNTRIIDRTGKTVWSRVIAPTTLSLSMGSVAEPVTITFSCSTRAKEVMVPFEFKDLPLPN